MHVENEECSVCWRGFSLQNVPVALGCGHSFCQECAAGFNKCPLCRRRIQAGAARPTNYSLLSLATRVNEAGRKETRDAQVQTETPPKLHRAIVPRGVEVITPGVALSVVVKLTRIQQQLVRFFKVAPNGASN